MNPVKFLIFPPFVTDFSTLKLFKAMAWRILSSLFSSYCSTFMMMKKQILAMKAFHYIQYHLQRMCNHWRIGLLVPSNQRIIIHGSSPSL